MSSLGIYLGPKTMTLVESKARRVLKHINIPLGTVSDELEEKMPEEVRIAALLKEEIRKNGIPAAEAGLALSGRDLIIRTFEIPVLPAEELPGAINFEAKKYVPFRLEDLFTDFQVRLDKINRKNMVLLVAIKREILDKHLSIFSQAGIKIDAVEYAGFSVLRCLELTGLKEKDVSAVINLDFQGEDEVNFTVLENGFPLFSRDILLSSGFQEAAKPEEIESGMILEKIKTEMRISLDYYHRKFPTKNIKKVFFIAALEQRSDLEAFIKEMGLSSQFVDISRYNIGKAAPLSSTFIKGYSASLFKEIKTEFKINLLEAKVKMETAKEMAIKLTPASLLATLKVGLKVERKTIALGLSICLLAFLIGLGQRISIQKNLKQAIGMRPQVSTVNPDASRQDLAKRDSEYKGKIDALDKLIKKQLYLTLALDIIPRLVPDGIQLANLSFSKGEEGKAELILEGIVYLGNSNKEFDLVNDFVLALRENSNFSKNFKGINIISMTSKQIDRVPVTNFVISCQAY